MFDKMKKKKAIQPLSEEDIQKKLYGAIKKPAQNDAVSSVPEVSVSQKPLDDKIKTDVPVPDTTPLDAAIYPLESDDSLDAIIDTPLDGGARDKKSGDKKSADKKSVYKQGSEKKNADTQREQQPKDVVADLFHDDLFAAKTVSEPVVVDPESLTDVTEDMVTSDVEFSTSSSDQIEAAENELYAQSAVTKNYRDEIFTSVAKDEIEEEIIEEKRAEETIVVTEKKETGPIKTNQAAQQTKATPGADPDAQQTVKDIVNSLKIDFAEFAEKLRRIPVKMIGIVCLLAVVAIISFNLWSKAKQDVVVPEKSGVRVREVAMASVVPASAKTERDIVITPTEKKETVNTVVPVQKKVVEPESYYAIQVCVYQTSQHAQKLVDDFQTTGHEAFYRNLTTRTGREYFIVYVGKYGSTKEANAAFSEFKQSKEYGQFPDSFIKWIKSGSQ